MFKSWEKWYQTISIFVGNTGVKGSAHAEMKNKLFNLITVSLATSVLLTPSQKSLAESLDYQTNTKEAQLLLSETGSRSDTKQEWIQSQRLVEEGKATVRTQSQLITATKQPTQSDQSSLNETMNWLEITPGGVFLASLLVGYILTRLWFKKNRVHRATLLVQQIEMLERIWRMES
ncbi:MAG: hypothetical protein U7123_08835 [Potamolinea sp.]